MITIMKEVLTDSKEDTEKIQEVKMMESLNRQHRKVIECMKQIQSVIQKTKTSITSWQNHLNESKNRHSCLENTI